MNYQIYFPSDLVRTLARAPAGQSVLGYKIGPVYVVVQLAHSGVEVPSNPEGLKKIGSLGPSTTETLQFVFDPKLRVPYIENSGTNTFSIILFEPPNFRNLEYLSVRPILLQSMGKELVPNKQSRYTDQLDIFEPFTEEFHDNSIANPEVIEKVNSVLRTRFDLGASSKRPDQVPSNSINPLLRIIIETVSFVQKIIIWSIYSLNYKVYGYNLVSVSNVLRQLDLRLKQINYFPIQFLCYYDKSILYNEESPLLKNLELPIFNSDLNINNSNYINFHNSAWLIFNDLLMGVVVHDFIVQNLDQVWRFVHKIFIQRILYREVSVLIHWIATHHPAGFKLNDELGHFMGDLFMWSLNGWKFIINDVIETRLSEGSKQQLVWCFKLFFKVLCYGGGLSFFLGFMIDVIDKLTFHISCFYFTSTKVFNRQIETLKSLFQLFRGKKYNILRNRIDNLNNYVIGSSNSFEIDQLLLGTLLFMVLTLLIPTVFAFYFMFFVMRLFILIALNFLENLQIMITFSPLFVCVLKLKNSRRLQGGIRFHYLMYEHGITYTKLSNKALTYNEIFTNFIKLFTDSKNFKSQLLSALSKGELLSTHYNHDLKFNYLMLPGNYDKTIDIWQEITKGSGQT